MNKNFVYAKGKTIFAIFLIAFLLISTNEVNVTASSPETTYFYVEPPEVKNVQPGDTFLITINVTQAPESYAWETHVSWDPNILKVFYIKEGDFLSRGIYTTTFVSYPSFDEANAAGEIMVGSSLFGDVPMNEWASGNGWLFNLGFNVTANGSSVINLFDTFLIDHLMAGAAQGKTYYTNEDSFFYNEPFHDIAVTSVTASLTETTEIVAINVTVTNEGNYTETGETFNITVYADTAVYDYEYDATDRLIKTTIVVGDEITVGTKTLTEPLAPGATTTLTFTWDTAGVAGGNYTISAETRGDDDTRNNFFIDGTFAVQVHDIAITNIAPSPSEVPVGGNVTINVTVENEGNFNETFDVTVYYDGTPIATKTSISLESGASTTLVFTWDTTDVAKDTYAIKAEASVVPDEIDTTDNTFTFEDAVKVRGAPAPDILPYAAVGIVIIVAAAIAIYFIWFRKPT